MNHKNSQMYRVFFATVLISVAAFNIAQSQEIKKVKAWMADYEMAFDMPTKNPEQMTEDEKKMVAMMELGKAMSGTKEGEPILRAYVTKTKMRVEQKGLIASLQVSDLEDSSSYNIYAPTKTAYKVPLATPKVSTEMQGDSMVEISTADAKVRLTDETSEIAGFACKKALLGITVGDVKQDITIWYAENLPKLFWGEYSYLEDVPGMALQISTTTNGMNVGIKAASLKETLVDDTLFTVPADYTIEEGFAYNGADDAVADTAVAADAGAEDYELAEGYRWTDDGELWGVEDTEGNIIVEPRYHDRYGYTAGLAPASRDGKYGVINKVGKEVIPMQYEDAFIASESRIWVKKDGLYGLIDTANKMILQPAYQTGSLFVDGLAFTQKDGKYGFVNESGKVVIPFVYDEVEIFLEGKAWVKKDEQAFYIDKEGKKVN
ncbi:WG repeat-containing protein [Olivibacter domesticus]|nr:WG repeat-containing protein [Olivibacter domesticus]